MAGLPPSALYSELRLVYDQRLIVQINLRPLIQRLATLIGVQIQHLVGTHFVTLTALIGVQIL